MAIQDDNTILNKGDLKAYHEAIAPMLGGTLLSRTNVSDHYSTDEKIVGVWTDGKPIYQKTVQPSSVQDGTVLISDDVDTYIYGEFIGYRNGEGQCVNYTIGGSQDITVQTGMYGWCSDNKIKLFNRGDIRATSIIATLRYTKTTDAAGSGVTTPGAYDINFPNTWKENTEIYFGNGLYGQRFTGTVTAAANTRAIVVLDASIISAKLVSQGGYWTDTNDSNYPIGSYSAGTNSFYKMACITGGDSSDGIFLNQYSNVARSNAPYDVWVTYTK